MLYDPKWNKPSLAGLIAWLKTMPPEQTYNFAKCDGTCLFGQYMSSIGIGWTDDMGSNSRTPYTDTLRTMGGFEVQIIASTSPFTFGAALERARSYHVAS